MNKEIIINHLDEEIRVAIMENRILTEIHYEREKDKSVVGNIYKGKVLKVFPGMESAFVGIGLSKAAFLYVDDVRTSNDYESDEDADNNNRKPANKQKQNIAEILKEGQEIMVQVSKGPIGTKGARITTHISLPGRNLVFMPHVNNVGISRQISNEKERNRLKQIVNKLKPTDAGFIVRTVAEGRSEEEFKKDIEYLLNTWKKVQESFKKASSPAILFDELNLTFRTIRDSLSSEIKSLIIDDEEEYNKIKNYLGSYLPQYSPILKFFKKNYNIFDYYGINTELDRAISRKVMLKTAGNLVIDQSEALTAIDVNTGRFTGSKNHEETILQTNLESAVEIVYQLKLRNIGGIIIIDFIDMENPENRNKVYQTLKDELKKDKARSKILAISEIGLVEMTRKRSRENLARYLCMPCPYCEGRARIKSPTTTFFEIYRDIRRISKMPDKPQNILIGVHPDIAEYIETHEKKSFHKMGKLIQGVITLRPSEKYHMEQFDILEA